MICSNYSLEYTQFTVYPLGLAVQYAFDTYLDGCMLWIKSNHHTMLDDNSKNKFGPSGGTLAFYSRTVSCHTQWKGHAHHILTLKVMFLNQHPLQTALSWIKQTTLNTMMGKTEVSNIWDIHLLWLLWSGGFSAWKRILCG